MRFIFTNCEVKQQLYLELLLSTNSIREFGDGPSAIEHSQGGALLIGLGVVVTLGCFARFAWEGRGTPAPVYPTDRLIVTGFYRHVRNPMYLGVLTVIFGQALLFGDARLLVYAGIVWLVFHVFITAYEEPTLSRRHGADYEDYRAHVRRWRQGLKAYAGRQAGGGSLEGLYSVCVRTPMAISGTPIRAMAFIRLSAKRSTTVMILAVVIGSPSMLRCDGVAPSMAGGIGSHRLSIN